MMHKKVLTLSCWIMLVGSTAAAAQTDSAVLAARTPAECLTTITAWRNRQPAALRAQGKTPDLAQIVRDAQAMGKQCVARFPIDQLPVGQIVPYTDLSIMAGDTVAARAAAVRGASVPGLTPRQRGDMMLTAERVAMLGVDPFAGLVVPAESIVNTLDSLPDSLAELKITGHQKLLDQYEYADVDDGIRHHAQAIIDIGRRVRATAPAAAQAMVPAFVSLARAAGDFLHADSALLILAAATKEMGNVPGAAAEFKASADLYALVGTAATPLNGQHWVNAPDQPATVSFGDGGKVYLIQFTAHWCVPCRKSYPGLKAVSEQLAGKPFEILYATELYGTFEGKPATAAEEIADDQTYYKQHNALPFRVAINPPSPATRATSNETRYRVQGIPQTVVIDKHGIIRQIVVGGDKGNEARLGRLVATLLAEK